MIYDLKTQHRRLTAQELAALPAIPYGARMYLQGTFGCYSLPHWRVSWPYWTSDPRFLENLRITVPGEDGEMNREGREDAKNFTQPLMNEPTNNVSTYTPTWRQRVCRRLFPQKYVEWPKLPPEKPASDCINCTVVTDFSFLDRLKILLFGAVRVCVRITTEHEIGEAYTNAGGMVAAPRWLEKGERP